jgi:hypothetical protein
LRFGIGTRSGYRKHHHHSANIHRNSDANQHANARTNRYTNRNANPANPNRH